ncbi:hypothetical protein K492DRAFT_170611 [Lichtheimia hyalospora FSU 10163]|nr:hypothetical protein K492DRAFT_170611 [Lichtheimia hyalospora FSU 10163]
MIYPIINPPVVQSQQAPTQKKEFTKKPKRKQVKNACINCQKACKKCDDGRACQRCIKLGLTATCVDSPRKERRKGVKRGPYKKRQPRAQQQQLAQQMEQQQCEQTFQQPCSFDWFDPTLACWPMQQEQPIWDNQLSTLDLFAVDNIPQQQSMLPMEDDFSAGSSPSNTTLSSPTTPPSAHSLLPAQQRIAMLQSQQQQMFQQQTLMLEQFQQKQQQSIPLQQQQTIPELASAWMFEPTQCCL